MSRNRAILVNKCEINANCCSLRLGSCLLLKRPRRLAAAALLTVFISLTSIFISTAQAETKPAPNINEYFRPFASGLGYTFRRAPDGIAVRIEFQVPADVGVDHLNRVTSFKLFDFCIERGFKFHRVFQWSQKDAGSKIQAVVDFDCIHEFWRIPAETEHFDSPELQKYTKDRRGGLLVKTAKPETNLLEGDVIFKMASKRISKRSQIYPIVLALPKGQQKDIPTMVLRNTLPVEIKLTPSYETLLTLEQIESEKKYFCPLVNEVKIKKVCAPTNAASAPQKVK